MLLYRLNNILISRKTKGIIPKVELKNTSIIPLVSKYNNSLNITISLVADNYERLLEVINNSSYVLFKSTTGSISLNKGDE